jgi:hypothetical protein
MTISLVLLKCIKCGTPVPAEEDEVAWVCAQCGQGLQLGETRLEPLAVQWAAPKPGKLNLDWRPFWVFTGTVAFKKRESYGSSKKPDELWNSPRRFYVPAFALPLPQLEDLAAELTRQQVALTPGQPQGTLQHCTMEAADAREATEFIVLTIEAEARDKLKQIEFTLTLSAPDLWLLPFAGNQVAL